jgi:hypothetical protein
MNKNYSDYFAQNKIHELIVDANLYRFFKFQASKMRWTEYPFEHLHLAVNMYAILEGIMVEGVANTIGVTDSMIMLKWKPQETKLLFNDKELNESYLK